MTSHSELGRTGPSRRAFLSAGAVTAVAAPLAVGATRADAATQAAAAGGALPHRKPDPALQALLRAVDPDRIHATILRLTQFGTRHTESSQTDPVRGIGAATTWVYGQFQAIAATSGGRMTVQKQSYTQQPVAGRLLGTTVITNVIATLQGTASPQRYYVVTGHLDSRVTDVTDSTSDAPGADDDGSGVACALELARLFAKHEFPGTLIFATVAGEEQGLFGSAYMAQQMANAGADVQGMFSNDIIGASQAWDGTPPDPFTVRLFVEGVPTDVTSAAIATMQSVGGENDSLSRQLGRYVAEVAPRELTGMNVRVIWRRDRYLRGSDHISFQTQGYPAARFTEPRENFNHEHRNVVVVDGVQNGDLIQYVDFDYCARVTRVNAAALWALASSPSTPKGLEIHVTAPAGYSGTNLTTLTWSANPESSLAGYEVVMRETSAADWTSATDVGNVTTVTLNISKDNLQFGLRAVDSAGNRSPVAFPEVVST
jgi:hypothetical protein